MIGSLESQLMAHTEAIHLRPTAALADRVLLPGDPGRALALAQLLLSEPRMFNHHRGLWGYTGAALEDGEPLTIQSTGMGGPSAAIVLQELIALGAGRAIRVGTCGALDARLQLGDLVIAREALAGDGASRALGAGERIAADPRLTAALAEGAPSARVGPILSTDLFYEPAPGPGTAAGGAAPDGAVAVEMEAATLFAIGAGAGVPVGCILAVSDVFTGAGDAARRRIDDEALGRAAELMGRAALAALAA